MAIAYTTGTINQPDSGSVGQSMAERIRDDVIAHVAWDLVEEFTAASGNVRWYVVKCLATPSGLPADYYVIIGRTLSNGELRLFFCEDYNSSSHTATYWPPGSTAAQTWDASGRNSQTFVLGANQPSGGAGQPYYLGWTPSGTSTKWWITTAQDGFTVAFNGPSNGFFHVGVYTPLTVLPIDMPIQMTGFTLSGTGYGAIARNPGVANINCAGYAFYVATAGGSTSGNGPLLGFSQHDLRYNDKLQGGSRPVAECGMAIFVGSSGDQAIYGYALGKQKRMRATSGPLPAGMAFGDAYVLQSRLWVPYLPTDGRLWDTGVASS